MIPRSLLLSKRLSQCLNPALPTGVHHRALSVYRQIFTLLTLDGLRRDISVWSPGLLPFFERSNTSTRPIVLGLLEDFYLPLGEDLRPIAHAFVLSVLPGLEEEGSEHFDRTVKLLDGFEISVGQNLFWRSILASICGNPAIGQAGVHFLNKRSPPISQDLRSEFREENATSDQKPELPLNARLLPRALSALLSSTDVLTVRGGLDLLLELVPLDTALYQHLGADERSQLMQSAVGVVQRRELSLNRRLWSWLGGNGRKVSLSEGDTTRLSATSPRNPTKFTEEEEREAVFLQKFGLKDLREAILKDTRLPPLLHFTAGQRPSEAEAATITGLMDVESVSETWPLDSDSLSLRQRPFRIFLALLDKWSVGALLTERAALDVLQALKVQVESVIPARNPSNDPIAIPSSVREEARELLTTTGMLFDAMDKEIFTRAMLREIAADLDSSQPIRHGSAIELLLFLLDNFGFDDEVSKNVHLPNLLAALLVRLDRYTSKPQADESRAAIIEIGVHTCIRLVDCLGSQALRSPMATVGEVNINLLDGVEHLYAAGHPQTADIHRKEPFDFHSIPVLTSLVRHAVAISSSAEAHLRLAHQIHSKNFFCRSLQLCAKILTRLSARTEEPVRQPSICLRKWVARLLDRAGVQRRAPDFVELENIVRVIYAASSHSTLWKRVDLLDALKISQTTANELFQRILDCLQPNMAALSVGATNLFWLTEDCTSQPQFMPRYLCAGLLSGDEEDFRRSLEGFATIWRNSSEAKISSADIAGPISKIIDMLRSQDATRRQAGETWLRHNVRSYTPIFTLVMRSLQDAEAASRDAHVVSSFSQACAGGVVIKSFGIQPHFDHKLLNYWLGNLLCLARYGAGGFLRAATTSGPVSGSTHERPNELLALRRDSAQQILGDSPTYMDLFVRTLLCYLRTDVVNKSSKALTRWLYSVTHCLCLDILQLFISKSGLSPTQLASAESCLLERLQISVENSTPERDHRMLLALHAVISCRCTTQSRLDIAPQQRSGSDKAADTGTTLLSPHPLFVKTVQAGLVIRKPRSVLTHWADFALMTLPLYRTASVELLLPIARHLCGVLREAVAQVRATFSNQHSIHAHDEQVADDDLINLLNVIERVVLLCNDEGQLTETLQPTDRLAVAHARKDGSQFSVITPPPRAAKQDQNDGNDSLIDEAPAQTEGGPGLFGYMTGIFSGDASSAARSASSNASGIKSASMEALQLGTEELHRLWALQSLKLDGSEHGLYVEEHAASLSVLLSRTHLRCRRAWERLYKKQPKATAEALIRCWFRSESLEDQEAVFQIFDFLAPASQTVVIFVCDVLSQRLPTPGSSHSIVSADQVVSDSTLLAFLDAFLGRVPSSATVDGIWPVVITLVKDIIANSAAHKAHLFSTLRCFTTLGDKVDLQAAGFGAAHTHRLHQDRRIRRELQETYIKLFDLCVLVAGKSQEAPGLPNRSHGTTELVTDDEKLRSVSADTSTFPNMPCSVVDYLATIALPALRRFVTDADKVANCSSNAVYYVISPPLRIKTSHRSFDHVDASVMRLATEIARFHGALRTLRPPLTDAFLDARFFKMAPSAGRWWCGPILAVHAVDREKHFLAELVGRITTSASANIFTNREAEIKQRSTSIRRLSFVLYSGAQDQFLPQLPAIQEKLVDVLRHQPPELVNAEAMLCFRVMLVRFQPRNLITLWPIIITELVRLFDIGSSKELPSDGSDSLTLLFQACKFVDLLLCMRTPEFQSHQWLFVNDAGLGVADDDGTFGSEDVTDNEGEESLFDRLASLISHSFPGEDAKTTAARSVSAEEKACAAPKEDSDRAILFRRLVPRRPLLIATRSIERVESLRPFLLTASRSSFARAAAPAGEPVDIRAIEWDLLHDLFDGGK